MGLLIIPFSCTIGESLRLCRESNKMYPRAHVIDGMMPAFIVVGITAISAKLNLKYRKYVGNTRVYLHQMNIIDIYNWFVKKLKEINGNIDIN